jgi:hypothetical protein
MADRTTTLKTETGDNVYPNIIGTNRKDSFADSSTIKHYYYGKTHKVGFQLANETNTKIQNSLQKPVGLTKTELVGVGTNGQENIEIGDNLTLANGKLSAMGGGGGSSDINYLNASFTNEDNFTGTFTGIINPDKINIIKATLYDGHLPIEIVISYIYSNLNEEGQVVGYVASGYLVVDGIIEEITVVQSPDGSKIIKGNPYNIKLTYSHFITMTNSTDNIALYLTIQNTDNTAFTTETLATYFAGKKVLANGNLHGAVPTYIAGEGGSIKVYYMTPGDSDINPTPDEFSDLSSFAISDLVTPVE